MIVVPVLLSPLGKEKSELAKNVLTLYTNNTNLNKDNYCMGALAPRNMRKGRYF